MPLFVLCSLCCCTIIFILTESDNFSYRHLLYLAHLLTLEKGNLVSTTFHHTQTKHRPQRISLTALGRSANGNVKHTRQLCFNERTQFQLFQGCVCVRVRASVRPQVRRRFLEQQQIQHGQLLVADDDQLGHRRQRVVPPPHDPTGTPETPSPLADRQQSKFKQGLLRPLTI